MPEATYTTKAQTAVSQRDASIPQDLLLPQSALSSLPKDLTPLPRTHPHFTALERDIITSPLRTLLNNISSRHWSSETVTRAFLKSAAVAQQLTNCLTALLVDSAIARARDLDAHLERTGQTVGPFHGLPVSLKDCFITPPVPSALGLTAWAAEPTSSLPESVLVSLLHDRGAVVHAKSNVPVAMMMPETDNNVTGRTSNPYNTFCSAGGSSGGEAALLSMCGSPLGIGTDIGGSIRIPSAFCGLYGLKPSFGRLPTYGARTAIPGNEFIFSVNGPMARDLDSLMLYCEVMLESAAGPWTRDPKCLPVPWRVRDNEAVRGKKLRLAFMPPHDGVVHAHPPVARALDHCRKACQQAGHEIVDWTPTGHGQVLKSVEDGFFKLGGPAIQAMLDKTGEPWFTGMHKYADGAKGAGLSADALREMNLVRNDLQKRHLDRWQEAGVDAIVAPISPWSAVRNGLTARKEGMTYIGFTAVWSLLDVSVGVVPVTKTTKEDGWEGVGGKPAPFGEMDERVMADWDAEVYDGTPVCLQIIGGRLEEEKVLGMVREVSETLKNSGKTVAS